ncbi:MAG TPA: aminotransferase class I/II-fold pyridoxal phosphate-dependent enzyme, partial [Ornithinibacter sp.]|nr:aminotransferase class I/II-fold pyridoxal phosphate-dependent enzyme [Ornithinibacter sp.]
MSAPLLRGLDSDHRRDRTSVKWVAYPPDVLPLWVAEMDAAPCPAVVDAVTSAMRRGDTGYGWGPRYAEAVARYADATWGWQVDTDASMIVPDVMIGASEVLRLLTDEGGPVVLSSPTYNAFYGFLDAIGRRTVDAPLTGDGRLDPEALRTAFRDATARGERAAYLLCNPQNPTGTVH